MVILKFSGLDMFLVGELGKEIHSKIAASYGLDDEDVILTDFDSWHYVLNNWHHNYAKNEEEWDKIDEWVESLPPEEKQKEIEKSWKNIFNIEPINSGWVKQGQYIQATFWKLSKTQIKKVQFFKSR